MLYCKPDPLLGKGRMDDKVDEVYGMYYLTVPDSSIYHYEQVLNKWWLRLCVIGEFTRQPLIRLSSAWIKCFLVCVPGIADDRVLFWVRSWGLVSLRRIRQLCSCRRFACRKIVFSTCSHSQNIFTTRWNPVRPLLQLYTVGCTTKQWKKPLRDLSWISWVAILYYCVA